MGAPKEYRICASKTRNKRQQENDADENNADGRGGDRRSGGSQAHRAFLAAAPGVKENWIFVQGYLRDEITLTLLFNVLDSL